MNEPVNPPSPAPASSPLRRVLKTSAIFAAGMAATVVINHFMAPHRSVHMPQNGGIFDVGFRAVDIIHPETAVAVDEGRQLTGGSIMWEFHNRADRPVQLSVPRQHFHIVYGVRDADFLEMPGFLRSGSPLVHTRQFVEIPASLIVDPRITLAPGEKRSFIAPGRGWLHESGKDLPGAGVEIVAGIDGQSHILVSAVTVREEAKPAAKSPTAPVAGL